MTTDGRVRGKNVRIAILRTTINQGHARIRYSLEWLYVVWQFAISDNTVLLCPCVTGQNLRRAQVIVNVFTNYTPSTLRVTITKSVVPSVCRRLRR